MSKLSEERLVIWVNKDLKKLAHRVARMRGETLGSLVRRAIRRELALLNYLSEEEEKALGLIET